MSETMPRLFTALAEWGACMLFLLQYSRRLRGPRFWLTAAGALAVQVLWLEGTGSLPVAFWMPAMAVAVGLMFLFLAFCGRSDLLGAGYCTVRAFLLAEFTASLEWQLYAFFVWETKIDGFVPATVFLVVIYGAVFLLAYHLEQRVSQGGNLPRMTGRELLSAASMGLAAFLISNMSFVTANPPFTSSVEQEIANIRTLVDLAGLMIIPAVYVFFGTEGMASGPSLMFISLPKVFEAMGPLGAIIGLVFFLMVVFAALTSNVSIMETLVANCMELFHTSRKKMSLIIALLSAGAATVICLGYNVLYFEVDLPTGAQAQQLLDVVDYISNSFLMPLISLLTCILVGWIIKPKWIIEEMESSGHPFRRKALYAFMIRYVTPVMMALLFLESIGLLSYLRRLLLG